MKKLCLLLLLCAPAIAQEDQVAKGDWNLALFATAGHSVSGSEADGGIITSGAHLGKVLTNALGPGFLRGKFEMGAGVTPLNVVWQDGDHTYGFGVTPVSFKWHFTSAGKVVPYVELAGGMLWTNHEVPPGSTDFNFTPQAAFGIQLLRADRKAVSFSVRYMHISNGGRVAPNPGTNTIQAMVAFHWLK
jgi:hypothetical protein